MINKDKTKNAQINSGQINEMGEIKTNTSDIKNIIR